jgi:hypothetical protein
VFQGAALGAITVCQTLAMFSCSALPVGSQSLLFAIAFSFFWLIGIFWHYYIEETTSLGSRFGLPFELAAVDCLKFAVDCPKFTVDCLKSVVDCPK